MAITQPASAASFVLNLKNNTKVSVETGTGEDRGGLAFSPDGKLLAVNAFSDLRIWHTATGKLWRQSTEVFGASVGFSLDGKVLAATHYLKGVYLWDVPTGKFLNSLPDSGEFGFSAISPDSRWLAGMSGGAARIWDLKTGQKVNDGDGHVDTIRSLAISPRFDAIATGGNDGALRLWDPLTGKQKHLLMNTDKFGYVSALCFSADGKWLASSDLGELGNSSVRLWETATGRLVYKLPGHGPLGGRRAVQFSTDGRYLFSWGDDFYLRKWDVKTGKALLEQCTRPKGLDLPEDDEDNVDNRLLFCADCAFTPQKDQLVLATRAGELHYFDVATGKETRVVKGSPSNVDCLAISPTGKQTVLGSYDGPSGFQMTVGDVVSGKTLFSMSFAGTPGEGKFSPDGRSLAAVCGNQIVVVEMATGKTRLSVQDLPVESRQLAFSRDGRFLITAMEDTTALVWDLAVLAEREAPKKDPSKR